MALEEFAGEWRCPVRGCVCYIQASDSKSIMGHREMHLHKNRELKGNWRRTKNGNGEILPKKNNPVLVSKIEFNNNYFKFNGYTYKLYGDVIFRTRNTDW